MVENAVDVVGEPEAKRRKDETLLIQLRDNSGNDCGGRIEVPSLVDVSQLSQLTNSLLDNTEKEQYTFYVNDVEIKTSLKATVEDGKVDQENVIYVVYTPVAVFRVRAVTRCSTEMPGHTEPVLAVQFSAEGRYLASGSGDTNVRLWNLTTETPSATLEGHQDHILVISWSPNGQKIASGCKKGEIRLWSPTTCKQIGKTLKGHKLFITGISWEPLHMDGSARRFVSSSKDTDLIIWDSITCKRLITMGSHTQSVTCCVWGGQGLIYSGSQDRTIGVWRPDGVYCRGLKGHAHWVNSLAVNTEYVMRTGAFEPAEAKQTNVLDKDPKELQLKAKKRYDAFLKAIGGYETLCSASDDFTLFMWKPEREKKPICRLTGHQATINDVKFSPDGRYIGSASFDKSVKLWCGKTGKFICAFRGHVRPVYSIAFSSDSRLIVSGSSDSTLKLFEIATKKMLKDLPGHADEVYCVDWSPDSQRVVSGGKDKVLRIWRK